MIKYLKKRLYPKGKPGGKMKNKAKWEKPKLVVLVRRDRPEEAVLAGCKSASISGAFISLSGCDTRWSVLGCQSLLCNNLMPS